MVERKTFFTPLVCQLIIFTIGIAVSVTLVFLTGAEKFSFGDAPDYLRLAGKLLTENVYPREHGTFPFFRAPLYPFFIYFVWLIFGQTILAIKLAQCVLSAITSVVVFRLAYMLFNRLPVAFLAGFAYCFDPFAALQVADIQTEPLHILLVACGIFFLLKSYRTPRLYLFFLTGITWALASLCRPSALPIGLAMLGFVFLVSIKRLGIQKAFGQIAVAVIAMVLTIAPWTISNYQTTGEFIVINDAGGFNLWFGNNPELLKFYDESTNTPETYSRHLKYLTNDLGKPGAMQDQIDEFERTSGYYSLKLTEREKLWRNEGLKNISESPARATSLFLHKLWDYWRPYLMFNAYPGYQVWISMIYFSTLYLLAFIGGLALFKEKEGKFSLAFILIFFLSGTLLHVAILTMIRYRIPYIEPYLMVLAAGGFMSIYGKIFDRDATEPVSAILT